MRILIGSRSVYGIPTANLYIRDELVTISADELRFRADELQRLVMQNYRMKLSPEQAEDFAERADGWIVAILLALRTMDSQGSIPQLTGGTEKIYEYLAEEVVNRQSPELRDFMYSTSILGDFDEALSNFVREENDSGSYLQNLEERNLFVTRTEGSEGNSYRYHQLFSEFLQEQFEKHDASRLLKLHSRAAQWHKNRQEWELAIQHKLDAKENKEAAKWIDTQASQFFATGRQHLLSRWKISLSKGKFDINSAAPRLLLYQAKALAEHSNLEEAEALLKKTIKSLRKSDDPKTLANAVTTLGMIRVIQGQFDNALKLGHESLEILSEIKLEKHFAHQTYQAQRLIGRAYFYLQIPEKAAKYFDLAIKGFRKLVKKSDKEHHQDYKHDLALLLTDIGFLAYSVGNSLEAQSAFQEALELHISAKSSSTAIARNNIAYVFHQTGRYEQAWKQYSLALNDAKKIGRVREEMGILSGQGSLLVDIDEYKEAEDIFNQVFNLSFLHNDIQAKKASQTGLSDIARIKGHHGEAMNLLRDAASHDGMDIFSPFYTLRLGRIYLDMGQIDLAREQFNLTLNKKGENNNLSEDKILANFFLFQTFFEDHEFEKGQKHLEISLEATAKLGYDQFLVVAARSHIPILKLISKSKFESQLSDLIRRAEGFKESSSKYSNGDKETSSNPVRLEIQTLGKNEVRVNGEIIPSSAWKSSRARALFYFILDNKKISKERVGLEFWPEFSMGKISSNFHATLWRVRHAFPAREVIVFNDDLYSINPKIPMWYDAAEFEDYLDQSKSEELSISSQAELLRRAVNLYNGEYLSEIYMTWAQLRRSELEGRYIEALQNIASFELSKGSHKQANEYYQQILSIDPYQDQIHLKIMDGLIKSGEKAAAKAHFLDYKNLLREELNSEPQPDLQKFFKDNHL